MKIQILAVCAALGAATVCPAAEAVRTTEKVQLLEPGAVCRLEHVVGRIHVRPATDRTARLVATVRVRATTEEQAKKDLERVRVDVESGPRSLVARSVFDHESEWSKAGGLVVRAFRGIDVEVVYELALPADAALELRTVSGSVDVEGAARLAARSTSGPMRLANVQGELVAEAVNGQLSLEHPRGGFRAKTVSAPVHVRLGPDAAAGGQIDTVSGPVMIVARPGVHPGKVRVEATSVSGRVQNPLSGGGALPITIATISGDIDVRLQ